MDHQLLVSELQALSVEAKRRHTDVKEASDKALEILKAGGAASLAKDALIRNSDALIAPVTLGCKTKTPKIIGIAITALQRLVALGGVPTSSLPSVLQTLNSVASQGVDIQLKILQALLSMLTYNRDAHDEVLGNALLLCFKLQDARVSVVSSTAAATLRQAVMLVFDRLSTDASVGETPSLALTLPGDTPTEVTVTPSALDAYCVLSDLCLLTARSGSSTGSGLLGWGGGDKEKPKLLKLSSLQRTFGLELIESILSGYEEAVKQRPELLHLLSYALDPLLLKLLAEKPSFPVALRVCRLIYLLIRSFMEQLPSEVQTCLSTLIRLGMGEADEDGGKKESVQPWFRVLALEIIRGICGDGKLLQNLFTQFDQRGDPKLFAKLVFSLSRLMNEKPNLLGVSDQMHGLGVPTGDGTGPHSGYLDIGFGMVASAANAGVSTVSSMMGSQGGGLGQQSSLKLKLIEQHDKAEAPVIPETYIYLLALQSLDSVATAIHALVARAQTPTAELIGMAESAWPALLAALSFAMATNLSDPLFAEVLQALQDFTLACNTLSLQVPRNAFLSTLDKYAVPPPVVSAMQTYLEGGAGRKDSVLSPDGLGITAALGVGGTTTAPSLSERNLACLKTTIATARTLSADLGDAWHDVLEVLQNATFMLGAKRPSVGRRPTVPSSPKIPSRIPEGRQSIDGSPGARSEVFDGIDSDEIAIAINVLFDSSTQMDDGSLTTFLSALCQLSTEMIGVDSLRPPETDEATPGTPKTPSFPMSPSPDNRRRTSGFTITSSTKSGEKSFALQKIRTVGMLNLGRLVNNDPDVGWGIVTRHLLGISRHTSAPSTVRLQASETLGDFLLGSMRTAKDRRIQHLVFDVLGGQVSAHPTSNLITTDYDVRSAGYHSLNQILESSGHSLEVGWTTIFSMLNDVCSKADTAPAVPSTPGGPASSLSAGRPSAYLKGDANLVRIAFPSLNLICTDFLSSLDPDAMRQCIACLGHFGRQQEDVNITLSAIGLMWNVSDAVQADSRDLWLLLLLQLLELGRDPRAEVRGSSMQTLFKCIELYGSTLPADLWEQVWWRVVHPLLEASKGDDTQVLALVSTGTIFSSFLDKLSSLSSFERIYTILLQTIEEAFTSGHTPQVHLASLKALERVVQAVTQKEDVLDKIWTTTVSMGSTIESREGYTQDTLVALVRIVSLLHDSHPDVASSSTRQDDISAILRTAMTYPHSPEYRPDVDVMSPLQKAIFELVSSSRVLEPTLVISNLAFYASLAYRDDISKSTAGAGKYTFVGLSKAAMPRLAQLAKQHAKDPQLLASGTIERVLETYGMPIGLKYKCPPSCRFNDDPPLWKTAMTAVNEVLAAILPLPAASSNEHAAKSEAVWSQVVSILGSILLADNATQSAEDEQFVLSILDAWAKTFIPAFMADGASVPERLFEQLADILSKGSRTYHYDVPATSAAGTTAAVVAESSEEIAYWAFDMLVSVSVSSASQAGHLQSALLTRYSHVLRRFVLDARLRGRLPFERVRQDELMYVLRQLVMTTTGKGSLPRSHLPRFYPHLLDIATIDRCLPTMWVLPSEYARLFSSTPESERMVNGQEEDAGDGDDLIEISAKDLARRCLELIGQELGLGTHTDTD